MIQRLAVFILFMLSLENKDEYLSQNSIHETLKLKIMCSMMARDYRNKTGNLLDYKYFSKHYRLIAIDLNKQKRNEEFRFNTTDQIYWWT